MTSCLPWLRHPPPPPSPPHAGPMTPSGNAAAYGRASYGRALPPHPQSDQSLSTSPLFTFPSEAREWSNVYLAACRGGLQVFARVPETVGFDIEVKMAVPNTVERTPAAEIERCVGPILDCLSYAVRPVYFLWRQSVVYLPTLPFVARHH